MTDEDLEKPEPTEKQIKLMDRLNRRWYGHGAPLVDDMIEDIRNRTIQSEMDHINNLNLQKINIDGKDVGLGDYLAGNTIYKQFHLEAINPDSEKGVHKYNNLFETNHAGLAVDGQVLRKCMGGLNNKQDFVKGFRVGEMEHQEGMKNTSMEGKVTGSKRIVYVISDDDEGIETEHEIGVKVARTKTGTLGRLQTVYNWHPNMQKCFKKHGKV